MQPLRISLKQITNCNNLLGVSIHYAIMNNNKPIKIIPYEFFLFLLLHPHQYSVVQAIYSV